VTDELQVRLEDGVLTVVFDRPAARNAMTFAMYEGLHAACERADADADVQVLVLTGAGQAFVAGTDIAQFASVHDRPGRHRLRARITRVVTASRTSPCRPSPSCAGRASAAGSPSPPPATCASPPGRALRRADRADARATACR
jgi:hypothetical protein